MLGSRGSQINSVMRRAKKDKPKLQQADEDGTHGPLSDNGDGDTNDYIARQISGNPFSSTSLSKPGLGEQTEWEIGGGLFNNLNQLDEDTRKKINEEYTRQDESGNDQTKSSTDVASKDRSTVTKGKSAIAGNSSRHPRK